MSRYSITDSKAWKFMSLPDREERMLVTSTQSVGNLPIGTKVLALEIKEGRLITSVSIVVQDGENWTQQVEVLRDKEIVDGMYEAFRTSEGFMLWAVCSGYLEWVGKN